VKLQKETKIHGKWYGDACGGAYGFELLGERWAALIVRELMFGPKRFNDIRAGLPGISAKVLTERLEGLEAAGILQRRMLPPPASAQVYELTEWGLRADEVLLAMCRWALCSPDWDRALPLSCAALLMSMRALFDGAAAGDLELACNLYVDIEAFRIALSGGRLLIERGEFAAPDITLSAPDTRPFKRLFYGKIAPEDLAGLGLTVAGDTAKLQRFVDLFALPEPAG
jgi:DNA-binding HxlR family transcriptional regulator